MNYPVLDPLLTPLGESQAVSLGEAFQREHQRGMPVPERWFVSPLRRCGQTVELEWGWLLPEGVPAVVIEVRR